jgi:hypothetical protein
VPAGSSALTTNKECATFEFANAFACNNTYMCNEYERLDNEFTKAIETHWNEVLECKERLERLKHQLVDAESEVDVVKRKKVSPTLLEKLEIP